MEIAEHNFGQNILIKLFLIVIVFLPIFIHAQSTSQSDAGVNVNLVVHGCNNNGICEASLGEDAISCALDCGSIATSTPTSTPTTTPVAPNAGGGSSSGTGFYNTSLIISNLSVTSDQNSAVISWAGNNTALSVFSWGATVDYEMGSVSDVFFIANHTAKIKDLSPGTHYYFKISARDLYGHTANYFGDFRTVAIPNLNTLPNVRNLSINNQSDTLVISWTNPPVSDFAGVVVVRSPYNYPTDPTDGKIIYEGEGSYVRDSSAQKDTNYYYSVFVYDSNRNYSSGTLVKRIIPQTLPTLSPTYAATSSPSISAISGGLMLSDFDFIQDGRSLSFPTSYIKVTTDKTVTVSIDATKLPGILHLGALQVSEPASGNSSLYLFGFNKARNTYDAQVNLLGLPTSIYPFIIDLKFSTSSEVVLASSFEAQSPERSAETKASERQDFYGIFLIVIISILGSLSIFFIIYVLYRLIRRFLSKRN